MQIPSDVTDSLSKIFEMDQRNQKVKKEVKNKNKNKNKNKLNRSAITNRASGREIVKKLDRLVSKGISLSTHNKMAVRRAVPVWGPEFKHGTQNPTIRCYLSSSGTNVTVSTTSATQLATVVTIMLDNFHNVSQLKALFDEYRPIFGKIWYTHTTLVTAVGGSAVQQGRCVGVVDYDDNTALTSFDNGQSYDTHKVFNLRGPAPKPKWQIWFEPLPDYEWLTTQQTNYGFAYFKLYANSGNIAMTGEAGLLEGWVDFQFRNQN